MRFITLWNYHLIWLIDDAMFVCLFDDLILGFCYSNSTRENAGSEFASTIIFILQAIRLTKCASTSIYLKFNLPQIYLKLGIII